MKNILLFCLAACSCFTATAQFVNTPTDWDVPDNFENDSNSGLVFGTRHSTIDLNGNGRPDLVDGIDNNTLTVWTNGSLTRYWKVYFNNGNGFDNAATDWDVPDDFENNTNAGLASGTRHATVDMNGDGRPDLVDGIDNNTLTVWTNGPLGSHWKVYLNNGSGFDNTAIDWDVPDAFENNSNAGLVYGPRHTTLDLNADGLPDLLDGIDNNTLTVWTNGSLSRHWRVYLNTGNGFNTTPIEWDVPDDFDTNSNSGLASGPRHSTFDLNGDGRPDLVDGIDNNTLNVWTNAPLARYWKVYLNNGSGFDNAATDWDVPDDFENDSNSGLAFGTRHSTTDISGDGRPDLVDGIDNNTLNVWTNASISRHWKVYFNTGTGFQQAEYIWDVPDDFENDSNSGLVGSNRHTTLDLDGDGLFDLVDGIDNTTLNVWTNASIARHWRVYGNPFVGLEDALAEGGLVVYPQPASDLVRVRFPEGIDGQEVSLFDLSGKMIWENSFGEQEAIQMDVSALPGGLYLIQARGRDGAGRPYLARQRFLVR